MLETSVHDNSLLWLHACRHRVVWLGLGKYDDSPLVFYKLLATKSFSLQSAGNCCVIKPSELSPYTLDVLAKAISRAFPKEYVATVL